MDDLEAIRKLKARYYRGIDTKDWELFASVLAEDIDVDLTRVGQPRYQGRDAFVASVQALPIVQSVHQGHMPEIELTGPDSATGVWALEDYLIFTDGTQHHGWGHYLESYVRRDGRWQIRTLVLSYLRIERSIGLPPVVAGAEGCAHLRGERPAG